MSKRFEISLRLDEVSYGFDVIEYDENMECVDIKPFPTRAAAQEYIELMKSQYH